MTACRITPTACIQSKQMPVRHCDLPWPGQIAGSIRDRMAGDIIAELAATEEGCEAITKPYPHLRSSKHQRL